jgi:hypothetical protein
MVEEALSNFGLFTDDENKIRLINPERVADSAELRDECKDFIDSMHFNYSFSLKCILKLFIKMFLNLKKLLIH